MLMELQGWKHLILEKDKCSVLHGFSEPQCLSLFHSSGHSPHATAFLKNPPSSLSLWHRPEGAISPMCSCPFHTACLYSLAWWLWEEGANA